MKRTLQARKNATQCSFYLNESMTDNFVIVLSFLLKWNKKTKLMFFSIKQNQEYACRAISEQNH